MKRQVFFVPGPLPGMNEILDMRSTRLFFRRGGRRRMTSMYHREKRKWTALIRTRLREEMIQPVEAAVDVTLKWVERDRRRDPDNIRAGVKLILDALVEHGTLKDDSQEEVRSITDYFCVNSKEPGVFVHISEVRDE